MTDNEINEAVARKLGYEHRPPGSYYAKRDAAGMTQSVEFVKPYCHSIAAAWEIVEFADTPFQLIKASPIEYEATFTTKLDDENEAYDVFASADTAPRAICLAFLKLEDK